MANETIITMVGNITADPELRYTQGGVPVANLTIAGVERVFDRQSGEWKDGDPLFMRASVWREFAEHVAASLTKGQRVIATGALKQRSFETKPTDGSAPEKRTTIELEIQEIGPSLRYGTTTFTKSAKGNSHGQAAPAVAAPATEVPQQHAAAPAAVTPQPVAVPAGAPAPVDDDVF